jgi:precorrin-2 methylase
MGMPDERIWSGLSELNPDDSHGYLSTLLVRNPSASSE